MTIPFTPLSRAEEIGFDIGYFAGASTSIFLLVMFTPISPAWLVVAIVLGLMSTYKIGQRENWTL